MVRCLLVLTTVLLVPITCVASHSSNGSQQNNPGTEKLTSSVDEGIGIEMVVQIRNALEANGITMDGIDDTIIDTVDDLMKTIMQDRRKSRKLRKLLRSKGLRLYSMSNNELLAALSSNEIGADFDGKIASSHNEIEISATPDDNMLNDIMQWFMSWFEGIETIGGGVDGIFGNLIEMMEPQINTEPETNSVVDNNTISAVNTDAEAMWNGFIQWLVSLFEGTGTIDGGVDGIFEDLMEMMEPQINTEPETNSVVDNNTISADNTDAEAMWNGFMQWWMEWVEWIEAFDVDGVLGEMLDMMEPQNTEPDTSKNNGSKTATVESLIMEKESESTPVENNPLQTVETVQDMAGTVDGAGQKDNEEVVQKPRGWVFSRLIRRLDDRLSRWQRRN